MPMLKTLATALMLLALCLTPSVTLAAPLGSPQPDIYGCGACGGDPGHDHNEDQKDEENPPPDDGNNP